SLAALTLSTTAASAPAPTLRPFSGNSTNTTSPSCSAANLVMPTVAVSPSRRTHSCWSVKRVSLMDQSSFALISVGHERRGRDAGGQRPAAHHQLQSRADFGKFGFDIAHRQRAIEAGAETTGRDFPHDPAAGGNLAAFAGRRLALGQYADTPFRHAVE